MTIEEFKNSSYILGQKVRVKSKKEIEKLLENCDPKNRDRWGLERALNHAGKTCRVSEVHRFERLNIYTNPNDFSTDSIPVLAIDLVKDIKPNKRAYDLRKKIIASGKALFFSSNGEMAGRGKGFILNEENVGVRIKKDGGSALTLPETGYVAGNLSLDQAEELLSELEIDVSVSTGMSFIRRSLKLIDPEKIEEMTYSYGR